MFPPAYVGDNKCGTMSFNTNFLGIILDNTLHWKKHVRAQIIKPCGVYKLLNQLFALVSFTNLLRFKTFYTY